MNLYNKAIIWPIRIYTGIVLLSSAFFSPPALSFIPVVLTAFYIFLRHWTFTNRLKLFYDQFIFFAIPALLTPSIGQWITLTLSLPVLLTVTASLENAAVAQLPKKSHVKRRPSNNLISMITTSVIVLIIAGFLNNLTLVTSGIIFLLYLGVLFVYITRKMPNKPVNEDQINSHIIAGKEETLTITITPVTGIAGSMIVTSPYEWLKATQETLPVKTQKINLDVTLTPPLSGPVTIYLDCYAVDRWGLMQIYFQISPIKLFVIPRAKYAEWLLKKYLTGTNAGISQLIRSISTMQQIHGLRQGIEYFGNRLFEAGDSLKNIDWKHTVKYNELVSKEFSDLHGQMALVLVNLIAGNAEEADILAYRIMTTAISLVAERIPAVMVSYDDKNIKQNTPTLRDNQLLNNFLDVARDIITIPKPAHYLNPPNFSRLKSNMSHIKNIKSKAAETLYNFMDIEYHILFNNATNNPLTKAITTGLSRMDMQVNIVIISMKNHDAEAISLSEYAFTPKGYSVITI